MKFYLILVIIFLSLFKVSDLSISLTYGDYAAFGFVTFFLRDYFKGVYSNQTFSKYWGYYIFILFLSAIINYTLFEGRFLNIFKTNLFSLVFFLIVYNLVYQRKLSTKSFLIGIWILSVLFLIKTWPEMQRAWTASELEFTIVNVFESSLNLNTWGFCLILFLLVSQYAWSINLFPNISLGYSIVLIAFIFFSYSRTAYSLVVLLIVWSVFYVKKTNLKNLILPTILFGILYIFQDLLNLLGFHITQSASSFFISKSDSYGEDLVDTRFYLINAKPILENFNEFNIFQILIGDGISTQHSFLSHTLVVTGISGFIIYIKRFWYTLKLSANNIKLKQNINSSKYLMLTIILLLVNDFVTNTSSFLPFSAFLSAIILAFLFANTEQTQQNNIDE